MGRLTELHILLYKIKIISRIEKHNILILGSDLEKALNKNKNLPLLALPNKLPMIVIPKNYNSEIINNKKIDMLGGYLINDIEYTDSLIKK